MQNLEPCWLLGTSGTVLSSALRRAQDRGLMLHGACQLYVTAIPRLEGELDIDV